MGICTSDCIALLADWNAQAQCIHLLHLSRPPVFAKVIALFSMQSGMHKHNAFTCHTWAGLGICTGDCIVLCVAKNAWAKYVHLLHLSWPRYLYRWLHCSLCSQKCFSTIYWPATPEQAPVLVQGIALFSAQPGMLEYNTFTYYTWAGYAIRTGDCSLRSHECWSTTYWAHHVPYIISNFEVPFDLYASTKKNMISFTVVDGYALSVTSCFLRNRYQQKMWLAEPQLINIWLLTWSRAVQQNTMEPEILWWFPLCVSKLWWLRKKPSDKLERNPDFIFAGFF